jgi:uncharacterized protein YggE
MKLAALAAASAAVALAVAFAGVGSTGEAQGQTAATPPTGITVNGTGSVATVPDRAEFSFGVTSTGRTASAALTANSAEVAKVIAALKQAGVAAADIQTQFVSLSPRTTENGEAIIGYIAHNSVSARLRNLDAAGAVIDAAVAAGANEVFGPNLTSSDRNELYRTALRAAIANAKAKATTIAAAAERTLGRVLAVVETGAAPPPMPVESTAPRAGVPIEPGTQQIEASVTVTFALA